SLETLLDADIDVAVELTVPKSTEDNVTFLVEHDIDTVVGTTGWDNDRLARLEATLAEHPKTAVPIAPNHSIRDVLATRFREHDIDTVVATTGSYHDRLARLEATLAEHPKTAVLIAPHFSIGAVLAMRFAELAAPYFDSAEVVETHHTRKLDAPSGTANHTAQRIAAARSSAGLPPVPDSTESDPLGARGAVIDGIHVHAIRQQGMNAHEEIHFGSDGEALTIRTDSHSTSAFMPGI